MKHTRVSRAAYHKERLDQCKVEGKCPQCGDDHNGHTVYCDPCRDISRQRNVNRKAKGMCQSCGQNKKAKHASNCTSCLKRDADNRCKLYKQRREDGLCQTCGEAATGRTLTGTLRCEVCWYKQFASRHLNSYGQWKELQTLMNSQAGRCVYTGEILSQHNASIDHIRPMTQGGEVHTTDNLQFVTRKVNRMKTDMGHEEFIEMCGLIFNRQSSAVA